MEEWVVVDDYESYEVSSLGNVRSIDRYISQCGRKDYFRAGKTKAQKTTMFGYRDVHLCKSGESKHIFVHRLVAKAFITNPENKPEVNHKDGVKYHNWKDNLEWTTSQENKKHAVEMGLLTGRKGESHHNNKLLDEDIRFIRCWIDIGYKNIDIAEVFNVHTSTISSIKNGNRFNHVT